MDPRAIGVTLVGDQNRVDTVPVAAFAKALLDVGTFTSRRAIASDFLDERDLHRVHPTPLDIQMVTMLTTGVYK